MSAGSRKAVVTAIAGNATLTVLKFGAAFATHSASMMNEAVHSLMDTLNQVFLFFGLVQGSRPADRRYAFGHGQKKYLWNLWSAIGLFSIGSGLGLAHAWHAYHRLDVQPAPGSVSLLGYAVPSLAVSALVLLIALVVEGYVLIVALREVLRRMRAEGESRPLAYLARAQDPTLIAVVLEDTVAVLGVLCAALGIGLSAWTGSRGWDIGFSVVIAVMLGLVAFFLGAVNMRYLSDIRDRGAERAFREVARGLREVERFHDLRSVVVDESNTSGLSLQSATAGCAPHDWLSLTGGSIGIGLPLATGAAVATPDRKVLAIDSDGSAMYTIQALWTMAHETLDVAVVIANNGRYSVLDMELDRVGAEAGGPIARSMFDLTGPDIDFVAIAQGLGVPGERVETAEALADALDRAYAATGPYLIDAVLPPMDF